MPALSKRKMSTSKTCLPELSTTRKETLSIQDTAVTSTPKIWHTMVILGTIPLRFSKDNINLICLSPTKSTDQHSMLPILTVRS